ncbi:MAG: nucleotide exchange factor GrpE [Planctomycetota bacterium]|nr:nucleotide exchange factor GrpE [Planctomycetota bacterium]
MATEEKEQDLPQEGEQVTPEAEPAEETLESLRAERDDYLARWQRSQADCMNMRRRSNEDLEARLRMRMQPLLESLLLVFDNLDMALASPAETDEAKNLAIGVRMTRDQLLSALGSEDVQRIETGGEFDPNLHQAIQMIPGSGQEPGTIVGTLRTGFTWRDVVLRSAQVHVAAEPEEAEEA